MEYDDGRRSLQYGSEGTAHSGQYEMGIGGQMNSETYGLNEPSATASGHQGSKSKSSKSSKKSKSSKSKQPSVALSASYDAPVAEQPNYDAVASQHNYYVPPNESAPGPVEDYTDSGTQEAPAPPVLPRRGSKSSITQKSGSFSNLFSSIRRSFSKKKKAASPVKAIETNGSEAAASSAFINERDLLSNESGNWNGSETWMNASPGETALEFETEVESMKKRKKKSQKAEDGRLTAASRHESVENLRSMRQKLVLSNVPAPALSSKAKLVRARVILLDGEEVTFDLDKWAGGDMLFALVCSHVNVDVVDQDFFGLTYIQELELPDVTTSGKKTKSNQKVWFWLDLASPIYKQQSDFEKWEFRFQVKFYPPDPTMLREDLSRYQLCLQLRQDLYYGKLPCSWVVHALLGSYTVQSEVGDYEDVVDEPDAENGNSALPAGVQYIQSFAFLHNQSVELLERIAELHRTHKGLTPEEADMRFLENAKRLPLYGVDLHNAMDASGTDIQLGVSSFGMVVYRNATCLNKFAWPKVVKVAFKRRHFYVYPRCDASAPDAEEVEFELADKRLSKRLWTIAVEHHAFWRLKSPDNLNRKLGSFKRRALSLLSLSNSSGTTPFRFTGHTLFEQRQIKQDAELNDTERDSQSVKFDRLVSKRLSNSMPHLLNADRESVRSSTVPASRLKAAQSLTSLVLPPPRLGSLRDLAGGSTRSLRATSNSNSNTGPPKSVRLQIGDEPPVFAQPERERLRKPLPTLPGNTAQLTIRPIEIELDDRRSSAANRNSEYAVPSKDSKPMSKGKKGKKLPPQPGQLLFAATVERQPTVSSVEDGYERLRDVVNPANGFDGDSLQRTLKRQPSDSETEIDRVPANYGEQLSTLDSPTYSDDHYPTMNSSMQPAGVTDLDQSTSNVPRATATVTLAPRPDYYYNAAPYMNSNGVPLNGHTVHSKPVAETDLDDFGPNAYAHPPTQGNSWHHDAPSLPASQPPQWLTQHATYDGDDGDTL